MESPRPPELRPTGCHPWYAGDGLDMRRPVISASPQTDEVIDLTNEPDSPPQQRDRSARATSQRPRQPRFGRDIMADIVDLEDEPDNTIDLDSPSSPEVQFVGASVRPQLPRPSPPRPRGFDFGSGLVRFLRLDDPRVQHLSGRGLFSRDPGWRTRGTRRPPQDVETFWIGERPGGAVDLTINLDMDGPLSMDYQIQGFSPDRGSRPTYKPPSPPPEGFTRKIGEDEVVCCPNCDVELGTGDEIQQQIWVVKQCGHVYCGQCATHRSKLNAKKASQPVKPFSKCQVDDCGKAVSAPKSMFQIYL